MIPAQTFVVLQQTHKTVHQTDPSGEGKEAFSGVINEVNMPLTGKC